MAKMKYQNQNRESQKQSGIGEAAPLEKNDNEFVGDDYPASSEREEGPRDDQDVNRPSDF